MRVLFILSAAVASAQFQNLTTNHDGSVAYFSFADRSTVTPGGVHSRVWRVTADGGPETFAERPEEQPELPSGFVPPSVAVYSNYYQLTVAGVGGDVVALNASRQCHSRGCVAAALNRLEAGDIQVQGLGVLSPGGRYAFVTRREGVNVRPPLIVDIRTGVQTEVEPRIDTPDASVSDTGLAAAAYYSQELYIIGATSSISAVSAWGDRNSTIASVTEPVIDSAGRYVIYVAESRRTSRRTLRLYDIATRTDREYLAGNGDLYHPRLSLDGSRILFVSTAQFGTADPPGLPQVFSVNRDGTGFRRVTDNPSGVQYAAVSGDGRVIWYVSGAGQLIRRDIQTGAEIEKIGRTVRISGWDWPLAAGSLGTIRGTGFGSDVRVFFGDTAAPVMAVRPQELTVLIPWGVIGSHTIRVERDSERSRWEMQPEVSAVVAEFAPKIFGRRSVDGDLVTAAHEDWRGLVTTEDPVRPGEFVHMYGTGFGPVDESGRVLRAISCSTYTADNRIVSVPVIYAGLAPGFAGVYQISVQIPREPYRPLMSLGCHETGGWLPVSAR